MSELEPVSKEIMNELERIKNEMPNPDDLLYYVLNERVGYKNTSEWYFHNGLTVTESELKLIKHIYLNEPQFEEEKLKKYVVRAKNQDKDGDHWYLFKNDYGFYNLMAYGLGSPVKFDTREEAEKWTNPQMEVVEVEE